MGFVSSRELDFEVPSVQKLAVSLEGFLRAILGLENDVAVANVLIGVLVLGEADSPG